MGIMKELKTIARDIWRIGGKGAPDNPYLGCRVIATWLKPWGGKPKGYQATGILRATFAVQGRTLIGEIEVQGPHGKKTISAPWSHNWLQVVVDSPRV